MFLFLLQQYIYDDPKRWNFAFNYYVMLTRADMHTQKVVSHLLIQVSRGLLHCRIWGSEHVDTAAESILSILLVNCTLHVLSFALKGGRISGIT